MCLWWSLSRLLMACLAPPPGPCTQHQQYRHYSPPLTHWGQGMTWDPTGFHALGWISPLACSHSQWTWISENSTGLQTARKSIVLLAAWLHLPSACKLPLFLFPRCSVCSFCTHESRRCEESLTCDNIISFFCLRLILLWTWNSTKLSASPQIRTDSGTR